MSSADGSGEGSGVHVQEVNFDGSGSGMTETYEEGSGSEGSGIQDIKFEGSGSEGSGSEDTSVVQPGCVCPVYEGSGSSTYVEPVYEGSTQEGSGIEGSAMEGSSMDGSGTEGSGTEHQDIEGSTQYGSGMEGSGVVQPLCECPSEEGSGIEGSGMEGSGLEGSGFVEPVFEGSATEGSGVVDAGFEGAAPEGSGMEGSGFVEPGFEGSAPEGSGMEGSGTEGSGFVEPGFEGSATEGSGVVEAGFEGSASEGSGMEGSGFVEPGLEGSSSEGSGTEGSGFEEPGLEGSASEGSGIEGSAEGFAMEGSSEGSGVEGSGLEEGSGAENSGKEEGSGIEHSGSEEGSRMEGSGLEESSGMEHSGSEEGSGIEQSGSEEGSAVEHSGSEEGSGMEGSGIEEGSAIEHSGSEEGSGTEHSGSEEGSGVEHSGSEEGSGVEHSGSEEGSGIENSGSEEGTGVEHSGSEEGSGMDHSGSEEGSGMEHSGSEEGSGMEHSGSGETTTESAEEIESSGFEETTTLGTTTTTLESSSTSSTTELPEIIDVGSGEEEEGSGESTSTTTEPSTTTTTVITTTETSEEGSGSGGEEEEVTTAEWVTTAAVNVTACSSEPCLNGAECTVTDIGYSCQCAEHYEGDDCERYVNPCVSNPCAFGATCNDLGEENGGLYNCTCNVGYTGSDCSQDIDECADGSHLCAEHANCINSVGSYDCQCGSGYRGDGFDKCYLIILFPYGTAEGDSVLAVPTSDAASAFNIQRSPFISINPELPFGDKYYDTVQISEKGLIYFGQEQFVLETAGEPVDLSTSEHALLAVFWDNFQTTTDNTGRVYYQVYNYFDGLTTEESEFVWNITSRVQTHFNVPEFHPGFTLKVTWSNMTMYPDYESYRSKPSTFQAIVTTDGCYTYTIFMYEEDSMLWETGRRYSDDALIAYTNGNGTSHTESSGEYRPDHITQAGASRQGEYFYDLTATATQTTKRTARCGCVDWYKNELGNPWVPDQQACPCTLLQNEIDGLQWWSVDSIMDLLNYYQSEGENWSFYYNTADITEWMYDELAIGSCYQLADGTGPRCCYGSASSGADSSSPEWWSNWWTHTLFSGPFSSQYWRYQIPHTTHNGEWVFDGDASEFSAYVSAALDGDLIPRRQCCVESESATHCGLYTELRPAAVCEGYAAPEPFYFWGDPHFTTSDGQSYTFNGQGEYWMVYAPGQASVQTRLAKATAEDGSLTDATAYVAFAVCEDSSGTEKLQFEVNFADSAGTGLIVKDTSGTDVTSQFTQTGSNVNSIHLRLSTLDGVTKYTATFSSGTSVTVHCQDHMLELELTLLTSAKGVSKGLLGTWNSNSADDFELRDGTVIDVATLQPTTHLDVLNGSLLEQPLYDFGLSWALTDASESIFYYSGSSGDTFSDHNPTGAGQPPFIENLLDQYDGTDHLATIKHNCTTDNAISRTCVFDYLVTNKSSIATASLNSERTAGSVTSITANSNPNITGISGTTFVSGYLQVQLDVQVTFTVVASDADGDTLSFSIFANNTVPGVTIDSSSGVATWTPTSAANDIVGTGSQELKVVVSDGQGGSNMYSVPIQLCRCLNSGACANNVLMGGTQNYQVVGCTCTEAYSGDYCADDRDGCVDGNGCYTGVSCTDNAAPLTGATCGSCPAGTTGDGSTCVSIDYCATNPCQQNCELFFGGYNCTCNEGYTINAGDMHVCDDIDECATTSPCSSKLNSHCVNSAGSYSCVCDTGYTMDAYGTCIDLDECSAASTHNCSVANGNECSNSFGSFYCSCLSGYEKSTTFDTLACSDIDECSLSDTLCAEGQTCSNTVGSYECITPRVVVTAAAGVLQPMLMTLLFMALVTYLVV